MWLMCLWSGTCDMQLMTFLGASTNGSPLCGWVTGTVGAAQRLREMHVAYCEGTQVQLTYTHQLAPTAGVCRPGLNLTRQASQHIGRAWRAVCAPGYHTWLQETSLEIQSHGPEGLKVLALRFTHAVGNQVAP